MKEKMLMKLEKDRLIAKVDNLELSLKQLQQDDETGNSKEKESHASPSKTKKEKFVFKMTGEPSVMPKSDRPNPHMNEAYEPTGSHLSV